MKTKPFEQLKHEIESAIEARDWGQVERLANADLRHQSGSQWFDYLIHWCNVGRLFAYATPDYTSGEFEKEFAIIVRQVAEARVLINLLREYKKADPARRTEVWAEIGRIVEEE